MSAVATRLQPGPFNCPVVTVAGTNGKGSTVAALQALALGHGKRVASYTSPHLLHFNERISINGRALSDQELCQAFTAVEQARGDISLTFFEFTTLAAIYSFSLAQLDLVILEVGLGGRLDAVNIIDADVAIITQIALDHADWLGSDLEQIGAEKAGIMRPGQIVVLADSNPPHSVINAAQLASRLDRFDLDFGWRQHLDSFSWYGTSNTGAGLEVGPLDQLFLPAESLAAAVQAYLALGFSMEESIAIECLSKVQLAGRHQQLEYDGYTLIADVAHNEAAATRLAQMVARQPPAGKVHILLGAMADKDIVAMVESFRSIIDGGWYCCGLPLERAFTPSALADILQQQDCEVAGQADRLEDLMAIITPAMDRQDLLLVTGSFFTVAELLQLLEQEGNQ